MHTGARGKQAQGEKRTQGAAGSTGQRCRHNIAHSCFALCLFSACSLLALGQGRGAEEADESAHSRRENAPRTAMSPVLCHVYLCHVSSVKNFYEDMF